MKNISKHISATLKTLRQEKGWSLDKTALETGVSKAMLGQIEREESSPTIATLWKIASGFHVSFSSFLEDTDNSKEKPIHRSQKIEKFNSSHEKVKVTPLFPFDEQLGCEIFAIDLLPAAKLLSPPHAAGVIEHVIVVTGTMQILLHGKWHTLQKGEGLRFNADQPHGYRNITTKKTCIHNVIHYPGKN